MDRLSELRLFIQVARLKTISAAGRSLGISTTAASKRLQDLEAALRAKLVDRTTRQLTLTEAGQRLFVRSADMLGELDAAFAEAREQRDAPMGTLRVMARRSFGLWHVAPALPAFRAAYPRIMLDLTLTEETELTPGRGIDVVIRLGAPEDKLVTAHRLTSAARVLCASPAYLANAGAPDTPDDLARHDCLTYRRAAEPAIWTFRDARGEQPVRARGSLQANTGEVLRAAAVAGLGMVLLPEWMVARDVAEGRLRACLTGYDAWPLPYRDAIYAVHRRGEVPAKVSAFVAHLCQVMGVADKPSRKAGQ